MSLTEVLDIFCTAFPFVPTNKLDELDEDLILPFEERLLIVGADRLTLDVRGVAS